jgi:hypothetical protein
LSVKLEDFFFGKTQRCIFGNGTGRNFVSKYWLSFVVVKSLNNKILHFFQVSRLMMEYSTYVIQYDKYNSENPKNSFIGLACKASFVCYIFVMQSLLERFTTGTSFYHLYTFVRDYKWNDSENDALFSVKTLMGQGGNLTLTLSSI